MWHTKYNGETEYFNDTQEAWLEKSALGIVKNIHSSNTLWIYLDKRVAEMTGDNKPKEEPIEFTDPELKKMDERLNLYFKENVNSHMQWSENDNFEKMVADVNNYWKWLRDNPPVMHKAVWNESTKEDDGWIEDWGAFKDAVYDYIAEGHGESGVRYLLKNRLGVSELATDKGLKYMTAKNLINFNFNKK